MKARKRFLTAILAALMVLMLCAGTALAYNIVKISERVSATAGETLTLGQAVCIKDADGYAYKADANDADLRPAIGIVGKSTASGSAVEIVTRGVLSGWTALTQGEYGYLSETAGAVTQSAPSYAQIMGVALSATEYSINPSSYLDTSAVTALGVLTGATPIILEGATANAFETTIVPTDPTADRTVTLPDASGTAMLSSLATNGADAANAVTGASNALVFEGTADAYETSLAAADPTADRTITLPDYTGGVPLIIAQGWTQTEITDTTAVDITGSSLTLADGWFTAGKTLKYTLGGTKTGANGTAMVIVNLDAAVISTLTSSGNTAGDWMAEIYVTEHTDTAHQAIMGKFIGADGAVTAFDVDTTDMNDAGTTVFKLQLDLGHADDSMTCDYIVIEHWNK